MTTPEASPPPDDRNDIKWPDSVVVNGKTFIIERIYVDGRDKPPMYGCSILPLRRRRADLIRDIERSQGPEWRK